MTTLTQAEVEFTVLDGLSSLGWQVTHGSDILPGKPNTERADYSRVAGPYLEDIHFGRRRLGNGYETGIHQL